MKNLNIISIILIGLFINSFVFSQSSNQNYVHSTKVMKSGIDSKSKIDVLSLGDKLETIAYFDGLGRPMQTVQKGHSPNSKDIISAKEYDQFGREPYQYLPYIGDSSSGNYFPNWETNISSFYDKDGDKVANTNHYYSETGFEDSPLNRVLQQGSPGDDWQLDKNPVNYTYRSNNISDYVRLFDHNPSSNSWSWSNNTFYDAGSLYANEFDDEDDNLTIEFKDKQGRVVLKESVLSYSQSARTYYLYDDFGNLSLVISPEGSDEFTSGPLSSDFIDRWCYQYTYDERHRMSSKKIPGKEVEYLVYDKLDRLVLYQDGNLRNNEEWIYFIYDILGREIANGITNHWDNYSWVWDGEMLQTSIYDTMICTESFDLNEPWYYTDNVWPHYLSQGGDLNSITYYDNYDFDVSNQFPYYTEQYCSSCESSPSDKIKGQITGTKTRVLDNTSTYITSVIYYDEFYRPIQQQSDNHLEGSDIISTLYDFVGNPIDIFHRHNDGQTESYDIVEHTNYVYDHADRITTINYGLKEMFYGRMVENTYNELSQLVEKNLHSKQGDRIQSIDYTYNVRGWLKKINNPDLDNDHTVIPSDDQPSAVEQVDNMTISGLDFSINIVNAMGVSSLQVGFTDDKNLAISEIQNPSNIRNVAIDENKTVVYDTTGGQNTELFFRMMNYNTRSYSLDLNGFSIHAEDDLGPLLDSLSYTIANELKDLGITDPGDADKMALMCKQYLYGTIGIIHFNEDANDLFGMELYYTANDYISSTDMSSIIPEGNFNGNIAGMRWKVDDGDTHGYGYEYDDLNRIIDADYGYRNGVYWGQGDKYDVKNIKYDLNGNIEELHRYGLQQMIEGQPHFSLMDLLIYKYDKNGSNSNMLRAVHDYAANDDQDLGVDFADHGSLSLEEYFYDENANLTQDLNKGIQSITYNHLNLPKEITFSSGDKINYLYDATGNKLNMTVTENNNTTRNTQYVGKFVYDKLNGVKLDYLLTPEGRIKASNGDIRNSKHEYYLTDHLGNIRAVIQQHPVVLSSSELLQENHYYPFGQEFVGLDATAGSNNYKYNGKELQQDLKLQWYDYGARFYDQQLGRWHVIDNKAEKYYSASTYTYALNNPLRFIDPDGNDIVDANGNPVTITMNKNDKGGYSASYAFAKGTDQTTINKFNQNGGRLISTLSQVATGRKMINNAINSDDNIHISINTTDDHLKIVSENGNTKLKGKLGGTRETLQRADSEGNILSVDFEVTIYEESINTLSEYDFKEYDDNKLTQDQKIARTGAHELHHATDPNDRKANIENRKLTKEEHKNAYNVGTKVANEFGEINKEKKQ